MKVDAENKSIILIMSVCNGHTAPTAVSQLKLFCWYF